MLPDELYKDKQIGAQTHTKACTFYFSLVMVMGFESIIVLVDVASD